MMVRRLKKNRPYYYGRLSDCCSNWRFPFDVSWQTTGLLKNQAVILGRQRKETKN